MNYIKTVHLTVMLNNAILICFLLDFCSMCVHDLTVQHPLEGQVKEIKRLHELLQNCEGHFYLSV